MPTSASTNTSDVSPVTEKILSDVETKSADRVAMAEAARTKASQFMNEGKFTEARIALEEADSLMAESTTSETKAAERKALAEAARVKASQYMAERKFDEAKKALEEADELEAEPPKWKEVSHRMITAIRSRLPKTNESAVASAEPEAVAATEAKSELGPVDQAMDIVSLYSKIAAAAGILPGGLLNFAAILAVQVTMVWRIAKVFGHDETKDRIRGSVLSLIGSVLPTGIGHGAAFAVASIPAVMTGAIIYFVATPVLAYALTRAVGNAFIMHFESGGTLLTFDPKAFADHFIGEFKSAGGVVADAVQPPSHGPSAV